jgi:DNA polymerase III gamma/tau subunit
MRFIHELSQQGVDMDQLAKGFLEYLRMVLVAKIDKSIIASAGLALADTQATALQEHAATMDGKHLIRMIQVFTDARTRIRTSPVPSLPLELALMELTEPTN